MNSTYQDLFRNNREWVESVLEADPDHFRRLVSGQAPRFLWIGCADSRVPANVITKLPPGAMFVHRNIANLVVHTDLNMLSVLEYAVTILEVEHVIVCGHYGCGGVRAAMSQKRFGLIDNWLRNIKDVYRFHKQELDDIVDPEARIRRLVELNVVEQVYNLCKTSTIQEAWETRSRPHVHGVVYGIENGLLKDLGITVRDDKEMDEIYRFEPRSP